MINRGLVRLASIACAALCGILAVFYIINIIRDFPGYTETFKYDSKYGSYMTLYMVTNIIYTLALIIVSLKVAMSFLHGNEEREVKFLSIAFISYAFKILIFIVGMIVFGVGLGYSAWIELVLCAIGIIAFIIYRLHIFSGMLESLLLCGIVGIGVVLSIIDLVIGVGGGLYLVAEILEMVMFIGFVGYYGLDMLAPAE